MVSNCDVSSKLALKAALDSQSERPAKDNLERERRMDPYSHFHCRQFSRKIYVFVGGKRTTTDVKGADFYTRPTLQREVSTIDWTACSESALCMLWRQEQLTRVRTANVLCER